MSPRLLPIVLLSGTNLFMTTAWYGHLRFRDKPRSIVVLVSRGIACFDYGLAVPANRTGGTVYSAAQSAAMQEVITLSLLAGFASVSLGQTLTSNQDFGFALVAAGAFFIYRTP